MAQGINALAHARPRRRPGSRLCLAARNRGEARPSLNWALMRAREDMTDGRRDTARQIILNFAEEVPAKEKVGHLRNLALSQWRQERNDVGAQDKAQAFEEFVHAALKDIYNKVDRIEQKCNLIASQVS